MTIQDITNILTVIKEKSVNKAAAVLYTSQPALSKCIKRVEQEYGIMLFERSKGASLALTDAGRHFEEMAETVLKAQTRFEDQLQQIRVQSDKTIQFAVTMQRAQTLSGPIMRYVYENYPDYRVNIKTYPSRELLEVLLSGVADMVLMVDGRYEKAGVYSQEIARSKEYIYLRNGSEAGRKAAIEAGRSFPVLSLHELDGETFVCNKKGSSSRYNLEKLLERNAVRGHIIDEPNHALRIAKVDSGYASAIVPDEVVQDTVLLDPSRIYSIPHDEQAYTGRYLVCRENFKDDIRYRIVLEALKQQFSRLAELEKTSRLLQQELRAEGLGTGVK